ncbi:hypothetical protein ABW20_dc0101760 [Dactylellina cionopaga]|nr:hypothetical protein ABW20_dc0101760 [Dactylellina cionopaga]
MRFFRTAFTAALALLSAPSFAALTAQQMTDNINSLTMKSQGLQRPARSITLLNGPLIVVGLGPLPTIITGFTDIVNTAQNAITTMAGSSPITVPADATMVANAFREFVRVHQALLNILIVKAGLFTTVPLIGVPVATALRGIEEVVDTIALGIIALVESKANGLSADADSLKTTIQTARSSYEGLQVKTKARRHFKDITV